jgi:hypothetical protein
MEEAKLLLARLQEARDNLDTEAKRASTLTPALQKAIQDARVTMSDAMTVLALQEGSCDNRQDGHFALVK